MQKNMSLTASVTRWSRLGSLAGALAMALSACDGEIPSGATATTAATMSALTNSDLVYHGGPTITNAHVVAIFWGPSWATGGIDAAKATTLANYIANFGTTGEYNVITQYSGIKQTNLAGGTENWIDTSRPPSVVTDISVQAEVQKYLASHPFDPSAIYEVFLPKSSYAKFGSLTSCGGSTIGFCGYHSRFVSGSNVVKYAVLPYPSCVSCQVTGFTVAQNFEHFVAHQTRAAVTDPEADAWWDGSGYEADDKCTWSPAPYIDSATGYAYNYEWSQELKACVKTR